MNAGRLEAASTAPPHDNAESSRRGNDHRAESPEDNADNYTRRGTRMADRDSLETAQYPAKHTASAREGERTLHQAEYGQRSPQVSKNYMASSTATSDSKQACGLDVDRLACRHAAGRATESTSSLCGEYDGTGGTRITCGKRRGINDGATLWQLSLPCLAKR